MQLIYSGKIQLCHSMFQMNYMIEGSGALVNEVGEEQPLKADDFALVNPEGLTQVILVKNTSTATRAISPSRWSAGCRRSLSE